MSEGINHLPWDSTFFGLPIGRFDIEHPEDWSKLQDEMICDNTYHLLYIFDHTGSQTPLPGAALIDTKVIYEKSLPPALFPLCPEIHFYRGTAPDADLYSLALVSGKYSRYKMDDHFPRGSYERLYKKWIENSVMGKLADVVLYYAESGKKLGMVTVRLQECLGSIGLIAVDPAHQGRGIATSLIRAAENWLLENGGQRMQVATQANNIAACSLYEKNGFKKISSTDIYHLWLK